MAVIMKDSFRFVLCKIAKLQNSRSFYLWCQFMEENWKRNWRRREKKEGNITGRKYNGKENEKRN